MIIRFKKTTNAQSTGSVLTCIRSDGSPTWQRPTDQHAGFFARHDLTHYAVETELTELQGFYSLIAAGWDIQDFEDPLGRRGQPLPWQANLIEALVGQLDMQSASQVEWSAEQINQSLATYNEQRQNQSAVGFRIQADQLARINSKLVELFARWDELASGESLQLTFEPTVFQEES